MASNKVERNGLLHGATISLAFALAAIHFFIGLFVETPGSPTSTQFILVGAVFLAGVVAVEAAFYRRSRPSASGLDPEAVHLTGILMFVFGRIIFVWVEETHPELGTHEPPAAATQ